MASSGPSAQELLLLAAAASIKLAENRSAEEVNFMAGFCTVLGDALALLALDAPSSAPSDE